MDSVNFPEDLSDYLDEYEAMCRAPHCDAMILHAPGKCLVCDYYPNRQQDRVDSNTNFTGEEDPAKFPCPSTYLRSGEKRDRWPGNREWPYEQL